MVKTRAIRLRVIEGSNERDQIVFCAFPPILAEVQTKLLYTCRACVVATWGSFLDSPGDFKGPKSNIEIEI